MGKKDKLIQKFIQWEMVGKYKLCLIHYIYIKVLVGVTENGEIKSNSKRKKWILLKSVAEMDVSFSQNQSVR